MINIKRFLRGLFSDHKKYWRDSDSNWEKSYWATRFHPHRETLIEELSLLQPFTSMLEIGCNCAPNLFRIKEKWPDVRLAGSDINERAIELAKSLLPDVEFKTREIGMNDFPDKSFDIVLADAALMYIPATEIIRAKREMLRLAKKAIVIVDQHNMFAGPYGHRFWEHWVRNYNHLFRGYDIHSRKIDNWGGLWNTLGYIFTVRIK